ncbi:hypothetical protein GEMRC1_013329 [Eukaryota sp. GEM-RC1]
MKLLLVCFAFLLCTQALQLPDSFTFSFYDAADDVAITLDIDQKLDGFGRARIRAVTAGTLDALTYVHKLGIPNGISQTIVDFEGKQFCIEHEDLFPISNIYFSAMTLNGTISYKGTEVEVWVNKKGVQTAQLFYVKDNALVAFGDVRADDSHKILSVVTSFEVRVFNRNHFIKPAGIICRRY